MPEDQGTLSTDSGGPSLPGATVQEPSGDLISTVDLPIPAQEAAEEKPSEETQKTEGKPEEAKDAKTEDTKQEDKAKEDLDRFDKHPRFQQLINERNTQRNQIEQLQQQINALQQKPKADEPPPYKDLAAMSNDQILEWYTENPQEMMTNLAKQVRHEVLSEVTQTLEAQKEAAERARVEKEYNEYARNNPDFNAMWDTGEIQAYMEEHPGHNAMSAHQILTYDKRVQAEVEKAIKEAQGKTVQSIQAKKNAQVLGSGPSAGGRAMNQIPAELKDTKKFGGLAAVLTQRSLARTSRQQAS